MKNLAEFNNFEFNNLLIPSFDHKELSDDDCGLPENPIFSNYSKYLWKRERAPLNNQSNTENNVKKLR